MRIYQQIFLRESWLGMKDKEGGFPRCCQSDFPQQVSNISEISLEKIKTIILQYNDYKM